MSSTYFTSENMNMIEGLLAEVREPGPERNFDRETAAYLGTLDALAIAYSRWDDEGGAIKQGAIS